MMQIKTIVVFLVFARFHQTLIKSNYKLEFYPRFWEWNGDN